jgi:hypothetical protein
VKILLASWLQGLHDPAGKRLFSAGSLFGLSSIPNSIAGNGTETRNTILQDNIVWFSFLKRICVKDIMIKRNADIFSIQSAM